MDRPLFVPAPPRLSRADLLAKLVRANEVFPEKEEGLMKYAEQVPLGLMLPARDLMRGPGQQHFDRPGDAWTGLSNDIAERGILSPIFLEWSTADGYAYAGEGNTRLAVAQELGLPTVPVVVYRKSLPLQGQSRGGEIGPFEFNKRQYLLDQGMTEDMPSWEFKMEDGYVPQYFQPHYLIGFLDQRTSGRLDLPDKYRDEDEWHPVNEPLGYYAETLGPESEESWWNREPMTWDDTPTHVFRTMSEEHFQDSLRKGFHQSDERGNYLGQLNDDPEGWAGYEDQAVPEGTVAGRWAYPGYLVNSPSGLGRVVKIQVRPEDEWEPHPDDDEGGYFRTFKPIPTDRFVAWTHPLAVKAGDTLSGQPFDRARFHPSGPPAKSV